MLRQLAAQPVAGPASGVGDPIGRRQGLLVDQRLGELDAQLSGQVVAAAISWLLVAALIYSVARKPSAER